MSPRRSVRSTRYASPTKKSPWRLGGTGTSSSRSMRHTCSPLCRPASANAGGNRSGAMAGSGEAAEPPHRPFIRAGRAGGAGPGRVRGDEPVPALPATPRAWAGAGGCGCPTPSSCPVVTRFEHSCKTNSPGIPFASVPSAVAGVLEKNQPPSLQTENFSLF